MIVEKQLLLLINLGSVIRPAPNNLVHHSTVRKIIHKWKTFNTIGNLPRSGHPSKFTPRLDFAMLREIVKNSKSYTSDSTGLGMLNVKVHGTANRKRLDKYGLFGRVIRRKPLLS